MGKTLAATAVPVVQAGYTAFVYNGIDTVHAWITAPNGDVTHSPLPRGTSFANALKALKSLLGTRHVLALRVMADGWDYDEVHRLVERELPQPMAYHRLTSEQWPIPWEPH
jgi:hypothetical protein